MKRRPRKDPVHPQERIFVLERDQGCVAPRLGGSYLDCWGYTTLAHVKDEPRMGVRAQSDRRHLLSVCQGHAEAGTKAGYCWVTDARNIALMRDMLAELNRATA